jgi:lantibiotic leader peptide-processing serine protease
MTNLLSKAILASIATLAASGAAHAATYIVTANAQSLDDRLASRIEAAGGTITARLPQIGVAIVESSDAGFAARAAGVSGVRSAAADVTLQFAVPEPQGEISESFANPPNSGDNDRFFDLQWGHAAIDAAGAWNQGYRGAGVRVAVLDSGVFCAHADIAPNLIAAESTSFVAGESYCNTSAAQSSHGTHVAGTIAAADNGLGTIGVAPEAKLIAVKVLSAATGSGGFAGIIQGIVYAADHGADVINMSLGTDLPRGAGADSNDIAELVNATKRAVQYARSQNALIVAAAGNDGRDLDHDASLVSFPAQLPGVLSISSTAPVAWAKAPDTTFLDNRASYTNYGQSAISFSAPGGDFVYPGNEACTLRGVTVPCWVFDMVMSTTRTGFYGWNAGTSMAAPHVSGVAALIIGKNGGEMDPAAVERILRASAEDLGKPGNDDTHGAGRVNANRAVD